MSSISLNQHILDYAGQYLYFSLKKLKEHLSAIDVKYKKNTVNQYLYHLTKEHVLFDAGKGWYSSIQQRCMLDTTSVEKIANRIRKHFPLLDFSCWSTRQMQPFAHHLQSDFTTFIYADKDALEAVTTQLIKWKYQAYNNPGIHDFEKYVSRQREGQLVIVRSSVSQEPVEGHFASVEKILIDLYVEKERSFLMDHQEYIRILTNLITGCRINIGRLLRYAGRRKVRDEILQITGLEKGNISV